MKKRILQLAAGALTLALTGIVGCSSDGSGCGSSSSGSDYCGSGTTWSGTTSQCEKN